MSDAPKYPGITITIGQRAFVLPEIVVGDLEDNEAAANLWGNPAATPRERMAAMVTLAHAALSRNYPDLTRQDVAKSLTLSQVPALSAALNGRAVDEPASGEAVPQS